MRKLLNALLAGLMATFSCSQTCRYGCAAESEYSFDQLLNAIAVVESGGDPRAIGDKGAAIGLFQIHKIYVDDVNRILHRVDDDGVAYWSYPPFKYQDRRSPLYSRKMAHIYLQHYGKGRSIEDMARIHNGGPDGWKKKCTEQYWLKVKAILEANNAK